MIDKKNLKILLKEVASSKSTAQDWAAKEGKTPQGGHLNMALWHLSQAMVNIKLARKMAKERGDG